MDGSTLDGRRKKILKVDKEISYYLLILILLYVVIFAN
jgi:hypothetical protein